MGILSNLNDTIRHIVKGSYFTRHIQYIKVLKLWDEVVGDPVNKKAKAIKFYNNILYVSTIDSIWANELYFLKDKIIKNYHDLFPQIKIKDIKFRTQKSDKTFFTPFKPSRKKTKQFYPKESVLLSGAEITKIKERVEKIQDKEVKEGAFKFFSAIACRDKTLRKAGFKECSKCGSLYKEKKNQEFNCCDVCRLIISPS